MSASDIDAGGAKVRIGADVNPFNDGLDRAEARLRAFATAALAIGAKIGGLGLSLGTGLVAAGSSFATTGAKLDELNKQLAGMKAGSPEFEKLSKEAARLNSIMGSESVSAAVKLNQSFQDMKDAVIAVAVKIGGAMAPAITAAVEYFTKVAKAVGNFVQNNRALAPQAAIVASALLAAGAVAGALGAAFYVTGPLIRLAMIGASAATLAFSVAVAVTNTTVAIANAALKAMSVVTFALGVAMRVVGGIIGIGTSILKAFAIAVALSTVTMALSTAGYGVAAKALKVLYVAKRLGTIAAVALTAVYAVQAAGMTALSAAYTVLSVAATICGAVMSAVSGNLLLTIVALAALAAAVVAVVIVVKLLGQVAVVVFQVIADAFSSVFWNLVEVGKSVFTSIGSYFSDVGTMAYEAFGAVANSAKVAFEKAVAFFKDLWGTATQTFAGISDAIAAGNIQLAMNVLWAGLKVTWVKGTDALKSIWSTSMIYITGALDQVGTSLKMIWDVTMIYLEGAFDQFVLYIRNAMQDAATFIAQSMASIDPTGYLLGDQESVKENDAAQRKMINQGAESREADRNKRLANTGSGSELEKRKADRQARIDALPQASPELARLQAELSALVAQAAEEKAKYVSGLAEKGQPGADQGKAMGASMQTASAQARNSEGAASSIAKAFNSGGANNPQIQALAEAKASNKLLETNNKLLAGLLKKKETTFNEVV